jgi:hypothetical protein
MCSTERSFGRNLRSLAAVSGCNELQRLHLDLQRINIFATEPTANKDSGTGYRNPRFVPPSAGGLIESAAIDIAINKTGRREQKWTNRIVYV